MTINIRIDNDALSILNPTAIVSGSKNYYGLNAVFTADWDALSKYVIFPKQACSVAMSGDCAVLPESLIAEAGVLPFGILGYDSGGELRISTNVAKLRILGGVNEADADPPSPDDEATWDSYIGEIAQKYIEQIKVEGAVTNDAESVTDGNVAVFDGATGKLIKDGGNGIGGTGSTGAVWGYIPLVKTDGGIELGKYIDFHLTSKDGIDRYSRIMISSGEDQPIFTFSGSSSGEGAIIKADQVHANQYHGTYYGNLGYPAKITLNGVEFSYAATNASASSFADGLIFYAPTSAGEENQILVSGSDGKPAWTDSAPLATAFKTGSATITFAQFYSAFTSALTTLSEKIENYEIADRSVTNKKLAIFNQTSIEEGGIYFYTAGADVVYSSYLGMFTIVNYSDGEVNLIAKDSPTSVTTVSARTVAGFSCGSGGMISRLFRCFFDAYAVRGEDSTGAAWGYIPLVKTDGGVEIGKYIDFHLNSDDGIDRYSRIMISSGEDQPIFTFSGSSSGEGAIIKADQVHANQYHGTYYGTLGYPAKVTLNGTQYSYAATNASAGAFAEGLKFYAPTSAGEENQILISGSDGIPVWSDSAPLATAFKTGDVTITLAQFYSAFTSALSALQAKNTELESRVAALEAKLG